MRTSRIVIVLVGLALALAAADAYAAPQGHSLTGVVLDGAGRPAASLVVKVMSGDQERGRSLTGDDGRYYVGGLPAGAYTVVVAPAGGGGPLLTQQVQVSGDTRLDLRVR